ncbi:hypothetical protein MMC07_009622 [Pseudocyphellaria aurata]|nr:hypothetical protein [Pseudocyphellaria aurata]
MVILSAGKAAYYWYAKTKGIIRSRPAHIERPLAQHLEWLNRESRYNTSTTPPNTTRVKIHRTQQNFHCQNPSRRRSTTEMAIDQASTKFQPWTSQWPDAKATLNAGAEPKTRRAVEAETNGNVKGTAHGTKHGDMLISDGTQWPLPADGDDDTDNTGK